MNLNKNKFNVKFIKFFQKLASHKIHIPIFPHPNHLITIKPANTIRSWHKYIKNITSTPNFGPETIGLHTITHLNKPFTYDEIATAILHSPTNKAPGHDGIPYELIKILINLPQNLHHFINFFLCIIKSE